MRNNLPPVLIAIGSGSGFAVARSLGSKGVKVYAMDTGKYAPARFSKYTLKPPWGYTTRVDGSLLTKMIDFAKQFDVKPIFIPTSDPLIEFLWENKQVLDKYFEFWDIYKHEMGIKMLDKKEFYKICESFEIPYPKTIFMDQNKDLTIVEKYFRFPVIIKPYFIHKWKKILKGEKVIYLENKSALIEVAKKHNDLLHESMVQEVIPGPESNIYVVKAYINKQGKVADYFVGRKLRQYPPNFGSGSLVESTYHPDVLKLSLQFFERLSINGLGGTEFKYDPRDKTFKMIEVNMRPQLWDGLMKVSGKDLIWLAYCDLANMECKKRTSQIYGPKWLYLFRDLASAFYFMKRGELTFKEWIMSYKNVKTFALIDISDPGTILGTLLYSAYQFLFYKL